jgi:RNA polymerase primary sigma factor
MRQLKISQSITNRESACLNKYLTDISKLEMIGPDEESRLAIRIRAGDQRALETLTKANLRFVVSVAKQYQFRGLSLSDLINEGNLGLIKAAQRYDETKGFKFISYAVWWIRQGIMQALNEQSRLVRLPGNQVNMSRRVQKAYNQLEQLHERTPSVSELSDSIDSTEEQVNAIMHYEFHHTSLDLPLGENNDGTLADLLADRNSPATDEKLAYTQSLEQEVSRCLQSLNERQKEVLCAFFGIGVPASSSLEEIGIKLNLSKERVRQIRDKAIMQLKSSKKMNILKQFLGS